MIEIKKSIPVNRKCRKCSEDCKQHRDLVVVKCPRFRQNDEPVTGDKAV